MIYFMICIEILSPSNESFCWGYRTKKITGNPNKTLDYTAHRSMKGAPELGNEIVKISIERK